MNAISGRILLQPIAKDADVNCALKVKEPDEQSQAVATDLKRMRVRIVVESGNHAEELCEVMSHSI